jgi:hypothetical protein
VQKRSLVRGYPGHDALLLFLRFFKKKNSDNDVLTDRTSEMFFDGKLDHARSKDDGLRGARCCCSLKVPSTYAFMATVRRLASTTQVLKPSSDRPRPISTRFGRPFTPVGPQVIMHFAPSTCMILTMSSSRPRWRFSAHEVRSFTLQSPGVFLVTLRSLPPLEVISSSS